MDSFASAECVGSPSSGCSQYADSGSCNAYNRHNYQCSWYYYSGDYHCSGSPYADCHTWDNDYGLCAESSFHNYNCNWDDYPHCVGYPNGGGYGGYGYGGGGDGWSRDWYTESYGSFSSFVGNENYPDLNFDQDWSYGEVYDGHDDYIGFQSSILVHIDSDGWYDFSIGCDDGCRLAIDGNEVFGYWEDQGYFTTTQSIYLGEGEHIYALDYFEDGGYARLMFNAPGVVVNSVTDCNNYGNQNDCEGVGCTWATGSCYGQYYCDQDWYGCVTSPGCSWVAGWYYFACSGSLSCSQITENACSVIGGCSWLCSEPSILSNWVVNCSQNCTYTGYNNNYVKNFSVSGVSNGYVNIQDSNLTMDRFDGLKYNCQIGIGNKTKLVLKPT